MAKAPKRNKWIIYNRESKLFEKEFPTKKQALEDESRFRVRGSKPKPVFRIPKNKDKFLSRNNSLNIKLLNQSTQPKFIIKLAKLLDTIAIDIVTLFLIAAVGIIPLWLLHFSMIAIIFYAIVVTLNLYFFIRKIFLKWRKINTVMSAEPENT